MMSVALQRVELRRRHAALETKITALQKAATELTCKKEATLAAREACSQAGTPRDPEDGANEALDVARAWLQRQVTAAELSEVLPTESHTPPEETTSRKRSQRPMSPMLGAKTWLRRKSHSGGEGLTV